jgi:hypothetical protein
VSHNSKQILCKKNSLFHYVQKSKYTRHLHSSISYASWAKVIEAEGLELLLLILLLGLLTFLLILHGPSFRLSYLDVLVLSTVRITRMKPLRLNEGWLFRRDIRIGLVLVGRLKWLCTDFEIRLPLEYLTRFWKTNLDESL